MRREKKLHTKLKKHNDSNINERDKIQTDTRKKYAQLTQNLIVKTTNLLLIR